ncbi:hypothetical protein [Ornithinimicrobium cerasi]|uniref:Uncharacterized protein n=1 Tax=Ornithinimicrobium cerasi TaxID=2248773 RepID=A0A285VHM7_9MICO|nr:hypothetical protein [Ornithinimicrobium cerasi]SOC53582.1 hypothetical protein SAMN05421879_10229 [Ornithinimicrobium cerasi]
MWTPESFPGADKVPWQLLIRARYVREVDAFVASTIVGQVAHVASLDDAARVATAAAEATRAMPAERLSRTARGDALIAVADFIDICPPWPWPWPWPWPGPWPGPWPWFEGRENPFEKIGSPYQGIVLEGALDLLGRAGSPQLHEQLGGVLKELGQL